MSKMFAGKAIRKIVRYGNSLAICIPKEYVKKHGIKPGDLFEVIFDDYVFLIPIDARKLRIKIEKARKLLGEALKSGSRNEFRSKIVPVF